MLSDEQIYECERIASIRHQRHKHSIRGQQITPADDLQWHFARAIEAEVRKQDDALIQQMLEALEEVNQAMPFPVAARARAAARTRSAPSTEPTSNSTRTTNDRL